MFAYMVPMMSGSHREFSTPFDDFWCCVGTGMESHAKHGDSIFWSRGNDLIVNLYIPATLNLPHPPIGLRLETAYPFADEVVLTVTRAEVKSASSISLRIPAWCETPGVSVDGRAVAPQVVDGYLRLHRAWRMGQVIRLTLPRKLRIEPTLDDPGTIALLLGPLVLAGDLGPATHPWDGLAPVLVSDDLSRGGALGRSIEPTAEPAAFRTQGLVRPTDLTLRPFTFQHDNNTAVYFRRFTETEWQREQLKFKAEQVRLQELDAHSADVVRLGDAEAEREHSLESKISYAVVYRGRAGRDARSGGFFECIMKVRPGPLTLQATYWGEERDRRFKILVDGVILAGEQLGGAGPSDFIERDYSIPPTLTNEKAVLRIRFEPETGFSAGPVFGLRLYAGVSTNA
jgi:hypothetical protein